MEKAELAKQIGTLEGQIADGEAQIRKTGEKIASAKRNRTYGIVAVVIAILGIGFFINYWWLWGFIGLVGLLTLLTAISNLGAANKESTEQQTWMSKSRATLAEWRALITAP